TKPGELNQTLSVPAPICLSCRSDLRISLNECLCTNCGARYLTRFGDPYIISDYGKTYSPKASARDLTYDRQVKLPIGDLVQLLKRDTEVGVCGFDRSTRYIIRYLGTQGIEVNRVYADQ